MYSFPEMHSTASTLLSAYASLATAMMLFRSMTNDIIPPPLKSYIATLINYLFTPLSTTATVTIDEQTGMTHNEIFDSAEVYLGTKISPSAERFKVNKNPRQKTILVSIEKNEQVYDTYDGLKLTWRFVSVDANNSGSHYSSEKKFFELTFDKRYREKVVNAYLPFVIEQAKEIREKNRAVKLYTRDAPYDDDYGSGGGMWGSINLEHPATFETLAMEPEMKWAIIKDLNRFVKRRDYYKKVGKAWKRGYLLYGPPGTGKSSLIAAMANYLKFDIYDLELTSLYSNSELRRILVSTTNRSIIVIEDIDCSVEMQDRAMGGYDTVNTKLTLSGLLNFIDGLWSSCGDERIIVFTTNHKHKLDPALLRPGRMDMHIHMSYCTFIGFKILAFNYLAIHDHPTLFPRIQALFQDVRVTPAEIAEELMRSEDIEVALEGIIDLLNRKRTEPEPENNDSNNDDDDDDTNGVEEEEDDVNGHESSSVKRLKTGKIIGKTLMNARMRPGRPLRGGRGGRMLRLRRG